MLEFMVRTSFLVEHETERSTVELASSINSNNINQMFVFVYII